VLGDEAGDGKTEVTVEAGGEKIPTQLDAVGKGTFEVTFHGEGERPHTINVMFNGDHVPGKGCCNVELLRFALFVIFIYYSNVLVIRPSLVLTISTPSMR